MDGKIISRIVEVIVQEVDPDQIILFGSQAEGTATEGSDYDICVLKKGITNKRAAARKLYRDLYGTGVAIDLIVEAAEQFDELKNNQYLVYHQIADQGRVVYEKPGVSAGMA